MTTTTSDQFVRDMLLKGRSIDFVADASGFPRESVAAILQELRDERDPEKSESSPDNSGTTPGQSADNSGTPAAVGNLASALPESQAKPSAPAALPEMREQARQIVQPRPEFKARVTNAVELLARADSIDDRRVQAALGRARKAMTDLAAQVNRYESHDEARARVAELEEELRAARAALRGGKAASSTQRESRNTEPLPCRKGCGKESPNPQGRAAHERHCTHAA